MKQMNGALFFSLLLFKLVSSFTSTSVVLRGRCSTTRSLNSRLGMNVMSPSLLEPSKVKSKYGSNVAQYLIDLHDSEATFDFCGGMMFQLLLSDRLYDHLKQVAATDDKLKENQPVIFDKEKSRMYQIPKYIQSSKVDNVRLFHGRELRNIPQAKGGFGFVLQLSYSDDICSDPEGWSKDEIQTYDGWNHDMGRKWRKASDYEAEGFLGFSSKFHPKAFGLNHRFYLHHDKNGRMWLSAEDGCEGTPSSG